MECNSYEMCELAGILTMDYPEQSGKVSFGRSFGGTRMEIVDDERNRCEANVDGEICVKTNFKLLGYYGNQEATDELFDDGDFLKTGDIGHLDDDGYLFFVDRKKDLLKYWSMQISPSKMSRD